MKEEKKDSGSLLRSFPLLDRFERDGKRIRTHAERRVKLNDTNIKALINILCYCYNHHKFSKVKYLDEK